MYLLLLKLVIKNVDFIIKNKLFLTLPNMEGNSDFKISEVIKF